jgi:glycosidase
MRPVTRLLISLTRFPSLPVSPAGKGPVFEFHILGSARDRYRFDQELFTISGNVIIPDFRAARVFAQKMNVQREAAKYPERGVKAGQINAMGLIDEIFHYVLRMYEESANPGVFSRALAHLQKTSGETGVRKTLLMFGALFPPREVYRGTTDLKAFLADESGGKPNNEILLEEMILLHFSNANPAFSPFKELFDDAELAAGSHYRLFTAALEEFFRSEKRFGPGNQFIFDLLRAPILASPHSLEGQLAYIKRQWGLILSEKFLTKLLGAGDLLKEEAEHQFPKGGTRPPTVVPHYPPWNADTSGRADPARFSADLEWMPRIVILAKNTYVWLDQLSKKYRRPISRIDQVPDEELDQLARWNITGLWLIGIWERSSASQKIKQMTGNPEAVASAYSIYDYDIAYELGGEEAFLNLRHRAWQRGIRMAGDMVPNHVGVYSRWVVDHPDYFIQSGESPFPNYRFTGTNLSENPDVELRIEDGYWTRRDAAVVFQRVDTRTGHARYIYHGNDGTNMPWNDTAQLDFLKPNVREEVIRTILHVARKFSIIRFDAAMTLTKQHFQRLWYPQPGSGGDIPSRSDHAMTREEFDRVFPLEFWREVVDRINAEMPETLLLAEAFWLLEGYFVRSLGMHRVYNSAFMHMLMGEENAKYRALIRNTLAFNPEILKRYVNFMSNPDEETAIAQFGNDDKYFGVAVMMVTLPGLPMIAHGQIEGFKEKYGMEYKRAYYDETADEELVRRHERELFPLMQNRRLFSHVEHFELYDLVDAGGMVNENVFAYSNMDGGERALICYHNKYEECAGWVKRGVPKVESSGDESGKRLVTRSLAEGLALDSGDGVYYIFKDRKSGLEFIRSGGELRDRGMFMRLSAFQYQVYMDFRRVDDHTGEYSRLAAELDGRGVSDVQESLTDLRLRPVHEAFSALFDENNLEWLRVLCSGQRTGSGIPGEKQDELLARYGSFMERVSGFLGAAGDQPLILEELAERITRLKSIAGERRAARAGAQIDPHPLRLIETPEDLALLFAWLLTSRLGRLISPSEVPRQSAFLFDRLKLDRTIRPVLGEDVQSAGSIRPTVDRLRLLIRFQETFTHSSEEETLQAVGGILDDGAVRTDLRTNSYKGVEYYNRESFESLMDWLFLLGLLNMTRPAPGVRKAKRSVPDTVSPHLLKVKSSSDRSGYRLEKLKSILTIPDTRSEPEPVRK